MKKIYVFALMASVIISACSKELMPEVNPDGEMVLVHLNLGGEIDIEDMPLTKAFTTDDLIGIQIYEGSTPYAYGLFDNAANLSFYLHSGKQYKFECAVVKNGKNKLTLFSQNYYVHYYEGDTYQTARFYSGDASRDRFSGYLMPFVTKNYSKGNSFGPTLNTKYYTSSNYFTLLSKGQITCSKNSVSSTNNMYGSGARPSEKYKYSEIEKYYGVLSNYTAQSETTINMELKRLSFGVKYSVAGITDGNVSITIKNAEQTFFSDSSISSDKTSESKVFAFYDGDSAYTYADNYAENFIVGVVWNRGVGVTQDLGTKTVQFKRNAVNHVKINLSTSTKSAGIAVSLEEPEITNETYSFGN